MSNDSILSMLSTAVPASACRRILGLAGHGPAGPAAKDLVDSVAGASSWCFRGLVLTNVCINSEGKGKKRIKESKRHC